MLDAPKLGSTYWIVADIWEVLVPVPVTLIAETDGLYTGRWWVSEDYTEDYEGLEPPAIYATKAAAWAVINGKVGKADEKEKVC